MKLHSFERLVVNQPLRPFTQRWLEARPLRRIGGPAPGRVLEIGCGQGLGAEIILRDFGAHEVHGFDLDEKQLARAQARSSKRLIQRRRGATQASPGDPDVVKFWRGCTNQLPVADAFYDAAFDFNVLHHVSEWQRGVAEVARVLKPGARFYLLETMSAFLNNPLGRVLMKHPRQNRFNAKQLAEEVQRAGFTICGQRGIVGCFRWMVAEKRS